MLRKKFFLGGVDYVGVHDSTGVPTTPGTASELLDVLSSFLVWFIENPNIALNPYVAVIKSQYNPYRTRT